MIFNPKYSPHTMLNYATKQFEKKGSTEDKGKAISNYIDENEKNMSVDQMIELSSKELENLTNNFNALKSRVENKITDSLNIAKAIDKDSLKFTMEDISEHSINTYTKFELTELKRQSEVETDDFLLKNSVYLSEIDYEYIGKRMRKKQHMIDIKIGIQKRYLQKSEESLNTRSHDRSSIRIPKLRTYREFRNNTENSICQICNEENNEKVLTCSV